MFLNGQNLLVRGVPRHLTEAKAVKTAVNGYTCDTRCNSKTVSDGNILQGFPTNKIASAHTSLSFILFVSENPVLLQLDMHCKR